MGAEVVRKDWVGALGERAAASADARRMGLLFWIDEDNLGLLGFKVLLNLRTSERSERRLVHRSRVPMLPAEPGPGSHAGRASGMGALPWRSWFAQ